jgi:hypothetical protein
MRMVEGIEIAPPPRELADQWKGTSEMVRLTCKAEEPYLRTNLNSCLADNILPESQKLFLRILRASEATDERKFDGLGHGQLVSGVFSDGSAEITLIDDQVADPVLPYRHGEQHTAQEGCDTNGQRPIHRFALIVYVDNDGTAWVRP